jgi:hypothetical protein
MYTFREIRYFEMSLGRQEMERANEETFFVGFQM